MNKDLGTPRDYSSLKHLVYFEIYPTEIGKLKEVIKQRLGDDVLLVEQEFGVTCEMPVQIIPEINRALSLENIAVYGIISSVLLERSENNAFHLKK